MKAQTTPEQEFVSEARALLGKGSLGFDGCIDALEGVLNSPDQPKGRKDIICESLKRYLDAANAESPAAGKAQWLFSGHCEKKTQFLESPEIEEVRDELRALIYPNDVGWEGLLPRIKRSRNEKIAKEYTEKLIRLTENYLVGQPHAKRGPVLMGLKDLFAEVLSELGGYLSPSCRLQLKNWLEEIRVLNQQATVRRLMADIDAAQRAGNWTAVERFALEMKEAGEGRSAQSFLNEVREYRYWRDFFDDVLRRFQEFKSGTPAAFPWTCFDQASVQGEDLLECVAGLEMYGLSHDCDSWREALACIAGNVLDSIKIETDSCIALNTVRRLRREWPRLLGELPNSREWAGFEASCLDGIREEVEKHLRAFRASYDGEQTPDMLLGCNKQLEKLVPYALESCSQFIRETGSLRALRDQIVAWKEECNPRVMEEGGVAKAEATFKEYEQGWANSPFLLMLRNDLQHLNRDLRLVAEAARYLEHGNPNAALRVLERVNLEGSARLRVQAEQMRIDREARIFIREGRLEKITPEVLSRVSPEARRMYESVKRGCAYLETFRKRLIDLQSKRDIVVYLREALLLAREQLPGDVELSSPGRAAWDEMRNQARLGMEERIEQEAEDLRNRCEPFPLKDEQELSNLENRMGALLKGMESPEFDPKLRQVMLDRIAMAETTLKVHRSCHEKDWERACVLLRDDGAKVDREQARGLDAVVRHSRCLQEQVSDEDWLCLYGDLRDLLLSSRENRRHYLALLRHVSFSNPNMSNHAAILQEKFPEEECLISLISLAANPRRPFAAAFPKEICQDDVELIRRLLVEWSDRLDNYTCLRTLWNSLNDDFRSRVWTKNESPLDRLMIKLGFRLSQIKAELANSSQDLDQLQRELHNYKIVGLLEDNPNGNTLLNLLDVALEVERRLRDLDRKDPWGRELSPSLADLQRLLDRFERDVRDLRGWQQAVSGRKMGVQAWNGLEEAWWDFRRRFDIYETGFHLNPQFWEQFIVVLERWLQALGQTHGQLKWQLPNASESERWRALLSGWQDSDEGRLWYAEYRMNPKDLLELETIYCEMLEQMQGFVSLHRELLTLIPEYKPDPDNALIELAKEPLTKLHEIKPITKPVKEIKQQLTDPKFNINVGTVYRHLFKR